MSYHQMIMAIHRPSPLIPHTPTRFLPILRSSASISVDLYRHYWATKQVLVIGVHLYQLFTSCTTLIYCFCEYRRRPDLVDVPADECIKRIGQCQELLGCFAPVWPETVQYRTLFDKLVDAFNTQPIGTVQPTAALPDTFEPDAPSNAQQDQLDLFDLFTGLSGDQHGAYTIGDAISAPNFASPGELMRGFWADSAFLGLES